MATVPAITTAHGSAHHTDLAIATITISDNNGDDGVECQVNAKGNKVACNNKWAHTINVAGNEYTWWEPKNTVTNDGTIYMITSTLRYEARVQGTAAPKNSFTTASNSIALPALPTADAEKREEHPKTSTFVTLSKTFDAPQPDPEISAWVTLSRTFTAHSAASTLVTLSETFTQSANLEKRSGEPTATMQVHAGNGAVPGLGVVTQTDIVYVTLPTLFNATGLPVSSDTLGSSTSHPHSTSDAPLTTDTGTPPGISTTSTTISSAITTSTVAGTTSDSLPAETSSAPTSGSAKIVEIGGGKHVVGGTMALAILAAGVAYFL